MISRRNCIILESRKKKFHTFECKTHSEQHAICWFNSFLVKNAGPISCPVKKTSKKFHPHIQLGKKKKVR